MRIATLQFAPRLGKVESNIRRADELLNAGMKRFNAGGGRRSLDLLVLPEMAFSGTFTLYFLPFAIPLLHGILSFFGYEESGTVLCR